MEPEALLKMKEVEMWTLVWSMGQMEQRRNENENQGLTGKQTEELEKILELHSEVFCEPRGLPPDRERVH